LFFFGFEMQKQKNIVFFCFLKVYGWRKSPNTQKKSFLFCISKPKKNKENKKHLLRLNQKVSSKLCFFWVFGFEVLGLLLFSTYYKLSDVPR